MCAAFNIRFRLLGNFTSYASFHWIFFFSEYWYCSQLESSAASQWLPELSSVQTVQPTAGLATIFFSNSALMENYMLYMGQEFMECWAFLISSQQYLSSPEQCYLLFVEILLCRLKILTLLLSVLLMSHWIWGSVQPPRFPSYPFKDITNQNWSLILSRRRSIWFTSHNHTIAKKRYSTAK